eukprot:1545736-Pleurochrysis_carterae.AAC.1
MHSIDEAEEEEGGVVSGAATEVNAESGAKSRDIEENAVEKVQLDMPPSWVDRLHIDRDRFQVRGRML